MNKLLMLAMPFLLCAFSGNEYKTVKTNVQSQRQKFKARYEAAAKAGKKVVLSEAGKYLHKSLTDTIFYYWYGTKGDSMAIQINPEKVLLPVDILYLLPLNIVALI
jgi:hypothetical protein